MTTRWQSTRYPGSAMAKSGDCVILKCFCALRFYNWRFRGWNKKQLESGSKIGCRADAVYLADEERYKKNNGERHIRDSEIELRTMSHRVTLCHNKGEIGDYSGHTSASMIEYFDVYCAGSSLFICKNLIPPISSSYEDNSTVIANCYLYDFA